MVIHSLDALYGGLSRTERARLIARCVRTQDFAILDQVRATVPEGEGWHFNHLMATIRRHTSYLHWIADSLRLQAERDAARLLWAASEHGHRQLRWQALWDIWKLVGYPVTTSEYARVVEMDTARPEPLASFAAYLWEANTPEEAEQAGWRPAVVTWLRATEAASDEAGQAEALALLHAAIKRGELPSPSQTPEGLALPWGACAAWLTPGRTEQVPAGPEQHIPLLEALSGMWARWEHHPDTEAAAVHERREMLARTLATVAGLDAASLPGSIHPPESLAEQAAQHEQVQAAWPWPKEDWRERAEYIGAQQAGNLAQWQAVLAVLAESQAQDFGGEDPIPDGLRAKLAATDAALALAGEAWTLAKDRFGTDEVGDLAPSEELAARLLDDARHVLRVCDGDDD